MCSLFWLRLLWSVQVALWGAGDGEKGWGQGSNERLPSGLPFCYQICWDTKRATVSFLRTSWGGERRLEDSGLWVRASDPAQLSGRSPPSSLSVTSLLRWLFLSCSTFFRSSASAKLQSLGKSALFHLRFMIVIISLLLFQVLTLKKM